MWFAIGLGIVAILIIIYFVIYSMCTTIVNDYSVLLQRIKRINRRYEFNDVDIIKLEVNYDNEDYYENVSTQDYLIYQLQYIQDEIKENINLFLENSNQYELYMSEIKKYSLALSTSTVAMDVFFVSAPVILRRNAASSLSLSFL